MQALTTDSWNIVERSATDLEHVLHVRDAYALGADLDIPALTPSVAPAEPADPAMRDALDAAWRQEWLRVSTNDADDASFVRERPRWYDVLENTLWVNDVARVEEDAIVRTRTRDAARLAELAQLDAAERRDRRTPRLYTDLVAAAEQRIGRTAGSFRLTVDVVPFDRPVMLRVNRTRVLVSSSLRSDPHAFTAAVAGVVDELVTD